jgi:hypothetical protein
MPDMKIFIKQQNTNKVYHMLPSEVMDQRSYFIVPVKCESYMELKALAQFPNIIWQFQAFHVSCLINAIGT